MTVRIFCIVVLLLSLVAGVFAAEKEEYTRYVKYPKPNYGTGEQAKRIKHGEYLVKIGDCAACHTGLEPGRATFSGGLGINTPFGKFYTPNITADKETGIGKWSDDDFVKTMHRGVAPGWKFLFPVFPYIYYARIKREDLLDIKAYLFGLKPVHAPKKDNDVPFPFNIRLLQLGWRTLFFYIQNKGEYKDDPSKSAEWNRGAYLVQGLGHCGMCHTPLNKLGAARTKYFLRGTMVDGYFAPDISGDGMVKDVSAKQIAETLHSGKHLSGGGHVHGPMEEVEHNSLRFVSKQDLKAMAVYLKSVHSAQLRKAAKHNDGDHPGKATYEDHCAVCHDTGAGGAPKLGDEAAWQPRIKLGLPALYKNAIHGINAMPPKGNCLSCSDEQIEEVVRYMVSEADGSGGHHVAKGKPPEKTTIKRGEKIYKQHCQSCHKQEPLSLTDKQAWQPRLKLGMPILMDRAVRGYGKHPARGGCKTCSDGDIIAATKYIAQQVKLKGDYRLW